MRRLEDAFGLFENGTISLDTFEKIVLAEQEAIHFGQLPYNLESLAPLAETGDDDRKESIEAVEQCLAWIEGYREAD